jgi:hypothetical protein
MSVSNSNREPSSTSSQATRRSRTDCGENPPPPRFSHVNSAGKLEVPNDCDASVILKLVDRSAGVYAFWLVVGRYGDGAMTASYDAADGDIRVDIPTGATMSSATLRPHLVQFLTPGAVTPLEGKPPTLFP